MEPACNSYVVHGAGPHKVIALHGWFGSADSWSVLKPLLDTENFTWIFLDCRGYGGAMSRTGEYTMDEVAADAIALADRLGFDKFSMAGHSMGGMAIQKALLRAPRRVHKLVAITPVPASGVRFDEAGWDLFSSASSSTAARRTIIDTSTGQRLPGRWVERMVRRSCDNSDATAFAAYLSSWAREDISAAVAGNKTPVKVLVGAHDPSLNAGFMEQTWLRWYPNAQLQILPNAGHYPMDESPIELAAAMETFLCD
jgi:pimeloyl-ACP methyl ester carboxylesterase